MFKTTDTLQFGAVFL